MQKQITTPPLVSVVMCTFNGEKYLDRQIESILAQDYSSIELVVIDDCSTDATWSKLLSWKEKHPNKIRVYQNEHNLGLNQNFCKAISLAEGEFIAISDQDDIWLMDKVSKTMPAFRDMNVVMAYTTSISTRNGEEVRGNPNELVQLFEGNDTRKIVMFPTVAGHDMIFRSVTGLKPLEIPVGVPIYDWWLAIKSTCIGAVVAIDSPGVKHRLHDTNAYYNDSKEEGVTIDSTVAIFNKIVSSGALRKNDAVWVQKMADAFAQHEASSKGKFDFKLFVHVFKYRNVIFYHIKRPGILRTKVAILKRCLQMAKW